MRHGIDETVDPVLFRADQFAILSPYRINSMLSHFRSEHGRNFVRKKSRAIHQAARFDFAGRACDADSIWDGLEPLDFRASHDVCALIGGHASVGLDEFL